MLVKDQGSDVAQGVDHDDPTVDNTKTCIGLAFSRIAATPKTGGLCLESQNRSFGSGKVGGVRRACKQPVASAGKEVEGVGGKHVRELMTCRVQCMRANPCVLRLTRVSGLLPSKT